MVKIFMPLFLISLIIPTVFAARDIQTVHTSGRRCPCRCLLNESGARKAAYYCSRPRFVYKCMLKPCYKDLQPGVACCANDIVPTVEASPSATPSASLSMSPSPSPSNRPKARLDCPCICERKRWARHACRYLPHCKVMKCASEGRRHRRRHGYKRKTRFQCCYESLY